MHHQLQKIINCTEGTKQRGAQKIYTHFSMQIIALNAMHYISVQL
jgi:hypothetical protein